MLMLHGRKISCSRIAGLFAGRRRLPGHYEFRACDPRRFHQPLARGYPGGVSGSPAGVRCGGADWPRALRCRRGEAAVERLVGAQWSDRRAAGEGPQSVARPPQWRHHDALFGTGASGVNRGERAGLREGFPQISRNHRVATGGSAENCLKIWWLRPGSNRGPQHYECCALTS